MLYDFQLLMGTLKAAVMELEGRSALRYCAIYKGFGLLCWRSERILIYGLSGYWIVPTEDAKSAIDQEVSSGGPCAPNLDLMAATNHGMAQWKPIDQEPKSFR